jgi:hypothetical protein
VPVASGSRANSVTNRWAWRRSAPICESTGQACSTCSRTLAEEGFQLEDLPYVQGGDRNALLQRRLSQYYYNTPLSAAISLGRAKEGRRDEKVLFAALTRVETFTPGWKRCAKRRPFLPASIRCRWCWPDLPASC